MPFPKNSRTTLVLTLAGVAIFISLFYFFPADTSVGLALRTKGLGFLAFIVAFGLAVFIHELGHFLAAKAFKVPVERFVIGFDREAMPMMPRCIWEKKIGETTYGLSLMPLGGYVKMSGVVHPDIEAYLEGKEKKDATSKDGEPEANAEAVTSTAIESAEAKNQFAAANEKTLTGQAILDQAALYRKPFWQKVIIYSAGVIMNILLAMAVLIFQDVRGRTVAAPMPPVVAWQAPGSFLLQHDIQEGDRVTAVLGELRTEKGAFIDAIAKTPVSTDYDLDNALTKLLEGLKRKDVVLSLTLELQRGEEQVSRALLVPLGEQEEHRPAQLAFFDMFASPAYVEFVIQDRPADRAGIERGDIVKTINGEPVNDWQELVYIIQQNAGKELDLTVERGEQTLAMKVKPEEGEQNEGQIGIIRGAAETMVIRKPLAAAVLDSPAMIKFHIVEYLKQLKKIGGRIAGGEIAKVRRDLGGPVAIARMAGQTANINLEYYLRFLVMFNIALAVINILPIPILDGGHIVLAAYEAVFRRPVPPKVLIPVLNGAFIVLITLFILITFSDLSKWIGLG